MRIVDAQVHIWRNQIPTRPPHRPVADFTGDELLAELDEAGVAAAVLHPPGWDPDSTERAVAAARRHPHRLAGLGTCPLDRPERRELIAGWKRQPGMLGLRCTFLGSQHRTWPTAGTLDWLWPAAERAGLPVALLAGAFLQLIIGRALRLARLDAAAMTEAVVGQRRRGVRPLLPEPPAIAHGG